MKIDRSLEQLPDVTADGSETEEWGCDAAADSSDSEGGCCNGVVKRADAAEGVASRDAAPGDPSSAVRASRALSPSQDKAQAKCCTTFY